MEKLRDEVLLNIRSCLVSVHGWISLRQLNNDYYTIIGERIPYQRLGYNRLEEFIQSENSLQLTRNGNEYFVNAKPTEKSAHMTEMVSRQKTKKRHSRVHMSRPPPRMYETSKWRPKSNIPNNSRNYQGSNRPRAVSHSQFVNKGSAGAYGAPSVGSKVVIPDHSTLNRQPLRAHNNQQNASSSKPAMNQRLTSNRVKENRVMVSCNDRNVGSCNGTDTSTAVSQKAAHSTSDANFSLALEKSDVSDNSINPLLATKRRITKKMSELSLERDSGNSSPTSDILPPSPCKTPDFVRTDNPLADLEAFAELHKLGEVKVSVVQMNSKRNRFHACKIKVGQKHTYTSYPNEFGNPLDAKNFSCEEALADLIPKCRKKSLMVSSEKDILERIPPMLEKHNHGIWAWQLKLDYSDRYKEILSDDWLKIVDSSPCVQIEKVSNDYILYHCKPGDKGQHRSKGVPVLNVSVPSNTVQFGEDGKLICHVTCVMSPGEIWCQQVGTEESELFGNMMDRLQIYYQGRESQLVPDSILTAGYYVAKHEGDYYRVRAVRVNETEVNCFFIDWGDELTVSKDDIFELKREYASAQAQAFICRLVGLEDLYEVPSSSACLASLYEKHVVLEMGDENSGTENTNDVLPVYMYDFDTGDSINKDLIPKLTMELASPNLQMDTITEVYVSNVESNGDVYVQVRTTGYENLQILKRQIEEQVEANPPVDILHEVTKENSAEKLFFMKYQLDGNWYRIKLIDWSPCGRMAQIYFVDHGNAHVIHVSQETLYPLESLDDVFNNYPHQAVRVRMSLDSIPENFVDLATKALPGDQPVLLKIMGMDVKEKIPVAELFTRSTDGGLFCINKSISLEAEMIKNEENNNLKGKSKLLPPFNSADCVPSAGTLQCPPIPEKDECFEVHIPFAVSPYNFFIQLAHSKRDLNKMMEKLQKRYENVCYGNLKLEEVLPGNIYASKHDDGFWYRTSVIKVIHSGSVSVFFCDFGYYQTLPLKQLIPLDDEFMQLPYQALKAKLAGVKPIQSKWTMQDCEKFKSMMEKKSFYAVLKEIEKDVLYESDIVLKVELIDTTSDDDVYAHMELIKNGIAVEE